MAVTRLFGASVKRREDPRLITGRATYTDDVKLPGMVHMAVLRSPYGHARIRSIDTSQAAQAPGVKGVYTNADLEGKINPLPCAWLIPDSDLKTPPYPALAKDRVRYAGDAVAMVVADSPAQARDALDLIQVDYEPLPAVTSQEQAAAPSAPQIHDEVPGNLAFHWKFANGDVDAAFRDAEVVVKHRFVQQRLVPNAMEPRSAVASWNPGAEELTVYNTTQNPHIARFLTSVICNIPENKVRFLARDVGGGFGSKIPYYGGEALAIFASRELGLPVKWTEDRRENFQATIHGRDQITEVEMAARRDGAITGLRVKALSNMGAYLSTAAPGVPTWLFALIVPGSYTFQNYACDVFGYFTNTTPTDAYRGAGRPEATFLIERMVDLLAAEVGMDPVDVRRKNFIPADAFPFTTAGTLSYDSGNYQAALDKALEMVDYAGLRQRQQQLRQQGQYIGLGLSTYVEVCGLAPSPAAGAMGFQGGLWEPATVRVLATGKVVVLTGTSPHGQGEETTFAQMVADQLGMPVEDVDVIHGDTGAIPMGWGTYGSRSTAVGGTAIFKATQKVVDKAKKLAAHLLEASPEDIVFDQGRFHVAGSPQKAMTIQDIALQANVAWNLPEGMQPGLEENHFHDPTNFTFPFGTHICVTEVDPETGAVKILRYVAVDDVGVVINPMIVDGQVHGGIAQGIGQALYEHAIYDDNGTLVTGSMLDYAVPNATQIPTMDLARTETPCPHNSTGIKGVGETGTIASTPAVVNSVVDALSPLGVRDIEMPLTPERVWRAIQQARAGGTMGQP
ncbi:MAG TPA: xanthine dehydrogenase family protein molybdopterin-binding subunit [Ktedonobacterales bacterium]|nr:xanthine dehydrogenase family protein molybdopterin-binding subunit [Ktedonobacterales bacterium]